MKNKLSLWSVLAFMLTVNFAIAQSVSGVVSDAGSGEPLPGVAVSEKGSNNATLTDFDGKFTINVGEGATLVFSSMGMETKEVAATSDFLQVSLDGTSQNLDEVVVTALGISREKKSLGYATQEVDGAEVTKVKDANFVNSLSGKVAGVEIKSSGTLGGSANVVIRGYKSLTGNNQALFVVDGVPISNATGNSGNVASGRGGYDYGNAAMDIDIARLLVMRAAWKIENGSKSRQDVSMAKIYVADTLNNVSDTAIQLNGAKGYSKDIILEWIYRYARQAKLVDGASEVHQMIINRFFNNYKTDFWHWGIGHDS